MVDFPDNASLRDWIRAVENTETSLRKYLPLIDDSWFQEMSSCIEITSIVPVCQERLSAAGAKLFYKVNRNHYRVDGNKRSALLVTAILFILNDHFIDMEASAMYELAEDVAKDLRKSEVVEAELEKVFLPHLISLKET